MEGGDNSTSGKNMTLNEYVKKDTATRLKFFFGFFVVGLFNNNGYTLVQAAADDLAKNFGEGQFMGVFLFVMITFGAISRFVHGRFFVRVKHTNRIALTAFMCFCSFIMISIACIYNTIHWMFYLAIFGSIFAGIS